MPENWDIQPEEVFTWVKDIDESEIEDAGYGMDELSEEEIETIYDFGDL